MAGSLKKSILVSRDLIPFTDFSCKLDHRESSFGYFGKLANVDELFQLNKDIDTVLEKNRRVDELQSKVDELKYLNSVVSKSLKSPSESDNRKGKRKGELNGKTRDDKKIRSCRKVNYRNK